MSFTDDTLDQDMALASDVIIPAADNNDAAGKVGNNTRANATNLPVMAKNGAVASIHTATDVDYYKCVLSGTGTAANFVRINFTDADGDLDLLLYDSQGNLVASSELRGSDTETVYLTGLAAGTYYAMVKGHDGALNNYTLDWDRTAYGPAADNNDAAGKVGNNTRANATNLPVMAKNGAVASIHTATDVDYYKCVLSGTGTAANFVRINFTDADGDLDLLLYDSQGNLVASSELRGSDTETVYLTGLAAGTYYAMVKGHDGALNNYTLDWDRTYYGPAADNNDAAGKVGNNTRANATNLPTLAKNGAVASIHTATDVDYYKCVLSSRGTADNFVRINFTDADGDLDLLLYDIKGNLLVSSENRGADIETVYLTGLAAGTYYAMVKGHDGALNNYTLDWDRTSYGPTADNNDAAGKVGNNTRANATNLPTLAKTGAVASIHTATDVDYYKCVLSSRGAADNFVRINFTDADGDLDLLLYDSKGNLLASSENHGADTETVYLTGLEAGTYYAMVKGHDGALNNYTLDWDRTSYGPTADNNDAAGKVGNNTRANATNLPTLAKTGAVASIHTATDVDYYKCVLPGNGSSRNFVRINFTDADGDLDLLLYDSKGNLVASSENRGEDSEIVYFTGFAAGAYYAMVKGNDGAVNTYTLDWDRTSYAPVADGNDTGGKNNNSLETAAKLTQLSSAGKDFSIHTATDVDYYQLILEGTGDSRNYAQISYTFPDGQLELALRDEGGNILKTAAAGNDGLGKISLAAFEAGIYYLEVSGTNGDVNNYTLSWDRINYGIQLDSNDKIGLPGNNSLGTAADLGSTENVGKTFSIHSAKDVDYYKITLQGAGRSSNYAQISFNSQNGALNLQLLDGSGSLVNASKTSDNDRQRIRLDGVSQGTYYLKVSGVSSAVNVYALAWNALNYEPAPDANDTGSKQNDSLAAATTLSTAKGANANLSIHASSDVDYYKLTLPGTGTPANYVRIDFLQADGQLELALLDSLGNYVDGAITATGGSAYANLATLAPGAYYLEVKGSAGATNKYNLSWDRSNYAPAADTHDASGKTGNNTMATAPTLTKEYNSGASLTIHNGADVDYFKFSLAATGDSRNFMGISFDAGLGLLDLRLFDAAGQEITGIFTENAGEKKADLNGLAAGAYYAKIFSPNGSVGSYKLAWDRSSHVVAPDSRDKGQPGTAGNDTIATATAMNKLVNQNVAESIHSASDVDFYRLELPGYGTGRNYFQINYDERLGELDVLLYDANGNRVAVDAQKGGGQAKLSLAGLEPGLFFVAVKGVNGAVNEYTRSWDRTDYAAPDKRDVGAPGNDTIGTATALKDNTNSGVAGTIHAPTDVDYYAITLSKKGVTGNYFKIDFNNNYGNLDLVLYDSNGTEVRRSDSLYANSERVNLTGLAAGTYYAKVYGVDGAVNNYTMTWNKTGKAITLARDYYEGNNTIATAKWLPFQNGYHNGATSLGSEGDVDYFKFHLSMRGTNSNHFTISGINATGEIELELVNASGDVLRQAASVSRTSKKLDLAALKPGTYYIKISSPTGGKGNYNISWECWNYAQSVSLKDHPGRWGEDRFESGDEKAATLLSYLGTVSGVNIYDASDVDYYRITLAEKGTAANYVQITYSQGWGTLALSLYDEAGNIVGASRKLTGTEKISLADLEAGVYYAAVQATDDSLGNAYVLSWNRAPVQQAVSSSTLNGFEGSVGSLSLTENTPAQNWSFSLYATGTASNYVSVECDASLDISLKDAAGRILYSGSASERINLGGLQSGDYSLEIKAAEPVLAETCQYGLDYDLGVYLESVKVRGPEYSSLFSLGGTEYAAIYGYGNVTRDDFKSGTYCGERLRSKDDPIYYDAEKCLQDGKDDNQCWAATVSNMLAYSGWGEMGIKSATGEYGEDVIFDAFNAAFPNAGGMVDDGIRWFFGSDYRSYSNSPTASRPGNYLGREGAPYLTKNYLTSISAMDQLASALQSGQAVGLSIKGSINHAINVWGYTFNAAKNKGAAGYYTGLVITDSNDGSYIANSRNSPDCLQVIPISWNAAQSAFYTSYYGSNQLQRFYTLDQAGGAQSIDNYAAPPEDMLKEGELDGMLAFAMEPSASVFQAGADLSHDSREKESGGMLAG